MQFQYTVHQQTQWTVIKLTSAYDRTAGNTTLIESSYCWIPRDELLFGLPMIDVYGNVLTTTGGRILICGMCLALTVEQIMFDGEKHVGNITF